jgi:SOS response regulatory protein OraA/RecX
VTALRAPRPGRVAVEVDGAPWRTLPLEVVVRAGLERDRELDRPRLRLLRRELRRHEALAAAGRVLRHRDHSARGLDEKLAVRNVAPAERAAALETLARAGLVDDTRFAVARAQSLAERGWGDEAVRAELERQGITLEATDEAVKALEPERDRALQIAARRGREPATARYLAAQGFDADAIEAALGGPIAD